MSGKFVAHGHALTETFSTLTGGALGMRLPATTAAAILRDNLAPRMEIIHLTRRGIRGGAIYDYLHLAAARKAGAARLYTLNLSDFLAFHRSGDPEIVHP